MDRHSHQINNVLIQVDGDTAISEAYVTVALWTLPNKQGVQTEIIGLGRYLDHWCFQDGIFAIDYREHVLDMPTATELNAGCVNRQSARDDSDASFAFLSREVDEGNCEALFTVLTRFDSRTNPLWLREGIRYFVSSLAAYCPS